MKNTPAILVTISRQFGCGGAYIGRRVAERLGYEYIDREILERAARYLGEEESDLSDREERLSGFWEGFFRAFAIGIPEAGYVPPSIRPVYDKDLFDAEAAIINEMADKHNSVIVGRGGFHVLKNRPGLVNVFFHASRDFRVKRISEVYKISAGEALARVEELDRERGRFIRTMTGVEWTDSRNYHLCVDTGLVDFILAEEMIVKLAENMRRKLGL